jgi:P-type E1-E2 ATPase
MISVEIPGFGSLRLEHLVLDVNGTLTNRGALIEDVTGRLQALAAALTVHVATTDTFGTAEAIALELGVDFTRVADATEKVRLLDGFGGERCAAIGNGRNDREMLQAAALGIAVIGPEGAAGATLAAADIVCRNIADALDLLLDQGVLIATLRS